MFVTVGMHYVRVWRLCNCDRCDICSILFDVLLVPDSKKNKISCMLSVDCKKY